MIIAQISDMHVAEPDTPHDAAFSGATGLAHAVSHLNRLDPKPDLVIATGDLVAVGEAAEYKRLRELLAPLEAPLYVLPGNHDDRDALRDAFSDHDYLPADGFLHYAVEAGSLRLIVLDTNVPGEEHGELCAERLAWLDARLAETSDQATLICLHHPPFRTGLRKMDETILVGADGLGDLIGRHNHVERILCGHLHRPITRRFHGTVALTCPSTAVQLELDLRPDDKLGLAKEPAACLLHYWDDDGGLVTHTSYVGKFETRTVFDGQNWITTEN
ncbi:MAG: phosphodiesterase [Minwuiales bacterium]|nr:phosphodiesterase [Minwuiales bacterium]